MKTLKVYSSFSRNTKEQDVYLTGNPQITFFKVVYRRHTNFSMESIQQTFNGTAAFGNRVTCQISRNGDLIHRMYLQATLPAIASNGWVDYVGLALIKNVELEIGGQRIDKQYGDWMYIWNELSLPTGKKTGFQAMVGDGLNDASPAKTIYVPLEFWFCRNPGLALPLIALQYHEVKVNIEFRPVAELKDYSGQVVGTTTADLSDASLWVDYIFLDTDERRRFAQLSHEYLIEQLQFTGEESVAANTTRTNPKLSFNHPVKELVWVLQDNAFVSNSSNEWFNYTTVSTTGTAAGGVNLCSTALLQLNGHDRFKERAGDYFNLVQPYQHHENIPSNKGINVYSFALKPEEHQPSGTLNMSRIDTATLQVTHPALSAGGKLRIYAVNYNVLRVMSGMGKKPAHNSRLPSRSHCTPRRINSVSNVFKARYNRLVRV